MQKIVLAMRYVEFRVWLHNSVYIIIDAYILTLNKYMLSTLKFPTGSLLKSVINIHYSSEKRKH